MEGGGEYAIKESPLRRAFIVASLIFIFWFVLIKDHDEPLDHGHDPMSRGGMEEVYITP